MKTKLLCALLFVFLEASVGFADFTKRNLVPGKIVIKQEETYKWQERIKRRIRLQQLEKMHEQMKQWEIFKTVA